MNRIAKIASLAGGAIALTVTWWAGVFESQQEKKANPFEALAKEYGIEDYNVKEGFFRDQVELNPQFKAVEAEVERFAAEEFERSGIKGMGAAHEYGQIKKRLLKERYRIEWRPIEEMSLCHF